MDRDRRNESWLNQPDPNRAEPETTPKTKENRGRRYRGFKVLVYVKVYNE
jgi:hypothetical protein